MKLLFGYVHKDGLVCQSQTKQWLGTSEYAVILFQRCSSIESLVARTDSSLAHS
jgi:hypothetical protein